MQNIIEVFCPVLQDLVLFESVLPSALNMGDDADDCGP